MRIIFFHIPKAGGSTLHSIFERMYLKDDIYTIQYNSNSWYENGELFKKLPLEELNKILLLKGHMFFGLHECFNDPSIKYVTFLRDPVERIISHYYFVLRSNEHFLHQTVKNKKMSLLEYAKSDLSWELDNCMTRMISGLQNIEINQCNDSHYDLAVKNLESYFRVIGIVERYDESLILLKNELGWKEYPYYQKLNQTERTHSVSKKTKEKIAERNRYDVQLYDWALEHFNERIKLGKNINQDVEILKIASSAFDEGFHMGQDVGFQKGLIKGAVERDERLFRKYPILKLVRSLKGFCLKKNRKVL